MAETHTVRGRREVPVPKDYFRAFYGPKGAVPDSYWEALIDASRRLHGGNEREQDIQKWLRKLTPERRKAKKAEIRRGYYEVIGLDPKEFRRYASAWNECRKRRFELWLRAERREERVQRYMFRCGLSSPQHFPKLDKRHLYTEEELRQVLRTESGCLANLEHYFEEEMQRRIKHCGSVRCEVCDSFRNDEKPNAEKP
jgi:hypothetical protein